jgi:protein O-mannosyl-transferase
MSLTPNQLKFIEKHRNHMSITDLAKALGVSPYDIHNKFSSVVEVTGLKTKFSLRAWFRSNWFILIGLAVSIFITYINTLNNVFISDDILYLVQNTKINTFDFVLEYPFTFFKALTNWFTYKSFGLIPPPFHLVNIFFHILGTWMFFLIVSILTKRKTAIISAFIWSLHPILTESVTWIGGGGYVMYTFFFFTSFALYLLSRYYTYAYPFSIVFFIITIGTSEKSIPLSLIYFAYEISIGKIKKNWKRIAPYLTISTFWAIMIFGVSSYFRYRVSQLQQQYYMEKGYDNPFIQIPVAITSYLHLMFWPDKLSFYQSSFIYSPLSYTLLNISFILFIIFIIYSFFKFKYAFFWISVLFISLSPSLTPLRISWWVAERYVYMGSAGIVAIISLILSRLSDIKSIRYFIYVLSFIIVISLMTRTIIRNNDWKTQDDLWIATGKTAPLDPKTHNNLGDMYARHGDYNKAISEFEIAVRLQGNYADGYHNLAVIYSEVNNFEKAIENLNKALTINPKIWQSEILLANIYYKQKQLDMALIHAQKSIEIKNDNIAAYLLTGYIYRDWGNKPKAKENFEKALFYDPNNPQIQKIISDL